MEFVTIHDLSRELNVPARVIRYRLVNLIAEGKLKEHDDFRRDDYKDDQHFVWKIQPHRFMHESGLKRDTPPLSTVANNSGNAPPSVVNQPVNATPPTGNEPPKTVTPPNTKSDTNAEDRSLARELIDVLKEQLRVKDAQLRDQSGKLKDEHELNMKLIGTTLQQAQEINKLLRLTGGKTELTEVDTKSERTINSTVNEQPTTDNNTDNISDVVVSDAGVQNTV